MNKVSKPVRWVALIYGAWVVAWFGAAVYGEVFLPHGELQKAAHFCLMLSGLPSGVLSLGVMPNGSLLAVAAAGILGWVQWCLAAMFV